MEAVMSKNERVRERISGVPNEQYFQTRQGAGWKLIAVEWERESAEPEPANEEVPYGLKVASDCVHLQYEPGEMAVLMLLMELIIQEFGFPRIAAELNQQGYRTRSADPWNEVAVFNLLPRLIEVGPHMFSTAEWAMRREKLKKFIGNQ
jgi:hypothetical protein